MTEGQTGQIQYSPHFSKRGYNNSKSIGPLPLIFTSSICLVQMNVFAKFDEIPLMILQDIMETKCYGHSVGHSDVKTVYLPTNLVCVGYNYSFPQTIDAICEV